MYTPEEFANKLKARGIIPHIDDARKYVEGTGKSEFEEKDFEYAYRAVQGETIGRAFRREKFDDGYVYYQRGSHGMYWARTTSEI